MDVVIEARMNLADLVYFKREEIKEICAKYGAYDCFSEISEVAANE